MPTRRTFHQTLPGAAALSAADAPAAVPPGIKLCAQAPAKPSPDMAGGGNARTAYGFAYMRALLNRANAEAKA